MACPASISLDTKVGRHPLHVLLIPSWYPTSDNPVSGVFFREQALMLQEAGINPGVVVPPHLRSKRHLRRVRTVGELAPRITREFKDGFPVYRGEIWRWYPGQMERSNVGLQMRAGLMMVRQYVAQHGFPDVIHAHSSLYGGLLAANVRDSLGIPVVLTEHSSAYQRDLVKFWQAPLVEHALRSSDRVFAVSTSLARNLKPYAPDLSIEVAGNTVDDSHFDFTPPPESMEPFTLVTIGSLTPNKGIDVLIRSLAITVRTADTRLIIGGDGPERAALEQLARDLGVAKQVSFLGRLDRNGVRDLLQRGHVAVSASFVETFGIVLIEALVCGRPVIATRSGGPETFVNERNGLLVPTGDPEAFAAAILAMKARYPMYDYRRLCKECVDQYGRGASIARLTEIYRSLSHKDSGQ